MNKVYILLFSVIAVLYSVLTCSVFILDIISAKNLIEISITILVMLTCLLPAIFGLIILKYEYELLTTTTKEL